MKKVEARGSGGAVIPVLTVSLGRISGPGHPFPLNLYPGVSSNSIIQFPSSKAAETNYSGPLIS